MTAAIGALFVDIVAYETFLFLLGSFFVPLFGVLAADYLLGAGPPVARALERARRLGVRLRALPVDPADRARRGGRSSLADVPGAGEVTVGASLPSFARRLRPLRRRTLRACAAWASSGSSRWIALTAASPAWAARRSTRRARCACSGSRPSSRRSWPTKTGHASPGSACRCSRRARRARSGFASRTTATIARWRSTSSASRGARRRPAAGSTRALADADWVHAGALTRADFPAETLAALARGRVLSLDGQGLVRRAEVGDLVVDADYDPEVLRHVGVLKLARDELDALGLELTEHVAVGSLGVREIVVTLGRSGGGRVYADGLAEHVPTIPLEGHRPDRRRRLLDDCLPLLPAPRHSPVSAARLANGAVGALLGTVTRPLIVIAGCDDGTYLVEVGATADEDQLAGRQEGAAVERERPLGLAPSWAAGARPRRGRGRLHGRPPPRPQAAAARLRTTAGRRGTSAAPAFPPGRAVALRGEPGPRPLRRPQPPATSRATAAASGARSPSSSPRSTTSRGARPRPLRPPGRPGVARWTPVDTRPTTVTDRASRRRDRRPGMWTDTRPRKPCPGARHSGVTLEAELAAGDDDRGAADLDPLDLLGGAVDPGVERARAADLDALGDLDLLAEGDAAVPGEVDGERAGGRARGRILGHAVRRGEHARLPAAFPSRRSS